jgi:hypothetical protein
MNSTPTLETEAPESKCTVLEYIENNPVAAVVQALAIGFAVGMVIRLLEGSREKEPEIDVKHKPTLEDAKFHIGSLLLPFLWPAWLKARDVAREGYSKSSGAVHEAVGKVKTGKLTAEGKERLKELENWVEKEAETLAGLGKKGAKGVEEWAARESERLADLGEKVKGIEEWLEKDILPAAETGWKKLRKFLG